MRAVNQVTVLTTAIGFMLLMSIAHGASKVGACENYKVIFDGRELSVPRPTGFVDICADRSPMCKALIGGFPNSVTTLAYFARQAEAPGTNHTQVAVDFSRYYIAQVHNRSRPEEFAAIKSRIAKANGDIPDHSNLPDYLGSMQTKRLGVLDESEDSITMGVVMKHEPPNGSKTNQQLLIATNAVALIKGNIFSLYLYEPYEGTGSLAGIRTRTRQWIQCFRQ